MKRPQQLVRLEKLCRRDVYYCWKLLSNQDFGKVLFSDFEDVLIEIRLNGVVVFFYVGTDLKLTWLDTLFVQLVSIHFILLH